MEYRSLISKTKTLSVMLTYTCPAECTDCGTLSSPRSKENISIADAKRYILDASGKDYRVIVFTGGEATLRWKDLLEGIRYATELGFLTRLVTNAHWANREDMAQEKLLALIEAGLKEINFSTGDEHARFIPIERVALATRLATASGLPTSVMIETRLRREISAERFRAEPDIQAMSADQLLLLSALESPWMPLDPNKVEEYERGLSATHADVEARKPCSSLLTTVTVQADGRIASCCGLGMRQIDELNIGVIGDSLAEIQRRGESDIVKLAIHYLGPMALLKMASEVDPSIGWDGMYAHQCQACSRLYSDHRVQRALRSRRGEIYRAVQESVVIDEAAAKSFIVGN